MKKMILVLTILIGSVAFADHHEEKKGQDFEQNKAKVLEKIDKRLAAMNEHKSCVTAAKDQASMKTCRGKMKEMRGEMKEDRKERRKKMKMMGK